MGRKEGRRGVVEDAGTHKSGKKIRPALPQNAIIIFPLPQFGFDHLPHGIVRQIDPRNAHLGHEQVAETVGPEEP